MRIKKLAAEFIVVFVASLVICTMVTFLWNRINYRDSTVDWETTFRFSIVFGIILTWVKSREIKE